LLDFAQITNSLQSLNTAQPVDKKRHFTQSDNLCVDDGAILILK